MTTVLLRGSGRILLLCGIVWPHSNAQFTLFSTFAVSHPNLRMAATTIKSANMKVRKLNLYLKVLKPDVLHFTETSVLFLLALNLNQNMLIKAYYVIIPLCTCSSSHHLNLLNAENVSGYEYFICTVNDFFSCTKWNHKKYQEIWIYTVLLKVYLRRPNPKYWWVNGAVLSSLFNIFCSPPCVVLYWPKQHACNPPGSFECKAPHVASRCWLGHPESAIERYELCSQRSTNQFTFWMNRFRHAKVVLILVIKTSTYALHFSMIAFFIVQNPVRAGTPYGSKYRSRFTFETTVTSWLRFPAGQGAIMSECVSCRGVLHRSVHKACDKLATCRTDIRFIWQPEVPF